MGTECPHCPRRCRAVGEAAVEEEEGEAVEEGEEGEEGEAAALPVRR